MNQLDQITNVIRQAVKESTNKNMRLQSAKALAAKIMGERNMHAAASKSAQTTSADAMLHGGFTWHVVGHYHDNGQPFTTLVRAKNGFSALLEVTYKLLQESNGAIDDMPDLILHRALNAFTGEIAQPSDEDSLDGTFVQDLVEHLEGFTPFSLTHPDLPQDHNLHLVAHQGRNFVGMFHVNAKVDVDMPQKLSDFLYIDGKGNSALIGQFQKAVGALPKRSALEKEFARINAMSACDSDPVYPIEDWQHEVHNMDTTLSYKDWVKNQYEMNQHETNGDNLRPIPTQLTHFSYFMIDRNGRTANWTVLDGRETVSWAQEQFGNAPTEAVQFTVQGEALCSTNGDTWRYFEEKGHNLPMMVHFAITQGKVKELSEILISKEDLHNQLLKAKSLLNI